MRIFNTLQQLWSYTLFCPVCDDIIREISLVSDDGIWTVDKVSKLDHILEVVGNLKLKTNGYKGNYDIIFNFNCIKNSFEFFSPGTTLHKEHINGLSFHLEGDCQKCLGSWILTDEIILDFHKKQLNNFALDIEEIWFNKQYIINYDYKITNVVMTIDKIINRPKLSGDEIETALGKPMTLPVVYFNWNDKKKTLNKIKTMITFS